MARLNIIVSSFQLLATLIAHSVVVTSTFHASTNADNSDTSAEQLTFQPLVYDNGMLHLVLKDLAKGLLSELADHTTVDLTPEIEETVRSTVSGFYNKIKEHPALKTRNIAFTNDPSVRLSPDQGENESASQPLLSKRKRSVMLEICSSYEEWISPAIAHSMEHITVRLLENQQFHVVKCENPLSSCSAVAARFRSECREKNTWTPAYVWSDASQQYAFSFVKMTTSCTCGVETLNPN